MKQAVGDLHLTVGKYRLRYRIADLAEGEPPLLYQAKALVRIARHRARASKIGRACCLWLRRGGMGLLKKWDRPAEKLEA